MGIARRYVQHPLDRGKPPNAHPPCCLPLCKWFSRIGVSQWAVPATKGTAAAVLVVFLRFSHLFLEIIR